MPRYGTGAVLGPNVVAVRVIGIQPRQNSVPENPVVLVSTNFLPLFKAVMVHLIPIAHYDPKDHYLGRMFCAIDTFGFLC